MNEFLLVGRGTQIHKVSSEQLRQHLEHVQHTPSTRLSFMTPDHHRARNFVVRELPRNGGQTLSAQTISVQLGLALSEVRTILDDLQQQLVFLVQKPAGEVCWAFPVTVEPTPHRLTFSSGESVFAA